MFNYYSWWVVGGWLGQKKTKLMLYSILVEIEVEVGVELGKTRVYRLVPGPPYVQLGEKTGFSDGRRRIVPPSPPR